MEATKRPWLMNLLLKMRKYKVTLRLKDCEYEELFRIIDAHDDLLAVCKWAIGQRANESSDNWYEVKKRLSAAVKKAEAE